jgi:hypothetical protein
MPLAAIRSIMLSEEGDKFHAGDRLTITRLLTCPRQVLIEDNIPLDVDIRKLDSRRKGTVIHADLQKHGSGGYAEVEFPRPGQPPPLLLDVPVSGRLDFVASDFSQIEDYKTHAESGQRNKGKPRFTPDNDAAQLNIGRILIARGILDIDPDEYRPRLIIWHTAQTARDGPPAWLDVEKPFMSEGDLAMFKPGGGEYTLLQIMDMYRHYALDRADGMPLDDALRNVPLAGRKMFRGQKCSLYCAAFEYCNTLEGIPTDDWPLR